MNFKKAKKTKTVAVLFSSGLDSTYLVYKNLMEGHRVKPYYIDIKNNVNKALIEKQNVEKLCSMFISEFPANMDRLKILTEVDVHLDWDNDLIFTQVPMWILSLSYAGTRSLDEIHIGYVCNDDAISYLDDIKKLYKAQQWLHKEKLPELKFPLTRTSKYEMMGELPAKYRYYITSCENPNLKPYFFKAKDDGRRMQYYEPCGDCVACRRIIKDNLRYNFIYSGMIDKYFTLLNEGDDMTRFKNTFPEKYALIKETMNQTYVEHYREESLKHSAILGKDSYGGSEAVEC